MKRACVWASGHDAPSSIQRLSAANWPAVSLSFSFGGIADQSSSWTRVAAKYNGLAIGLPGTTEASSLSPPRNIAAREVRSKSPFSFFPSSPWHARHLELKIPRTFKANRRSPSRSEAMVSVVNPTKMAKNNRMSDDVGVDRLLRGFQIALFHCLHNGFVLRNDLVKAINARVIHKQSRRDALPNGLQFA